MERKGFKKKHVFVFVFLFVSYFGVCLVFGIAPRLASQRGSEHAAESLKRRETKAPREILPARSSYFVFVNAVFRI